MKLTACPLGFLLAIPASAQPSRAPVPKEMLHGRTLVVKAANLSIDAPSDGWKWEEIHSTRKLPDDYIGTYIAIDPETGRYFIVTLPGGRNRGMSEDFERGVLAAVRDASPQAKASLESSHSDVPVPGTLHYQYEHPYPNVGLQHTFAYTFATGTTVTLMVMTPEEVEPPAFTQFVKSAKLLEPLPRETSSGAPYGTAPGYFAVLFITAGIAGLINRSKKRRVVNSFKVATWVTVVVFLADLAFAIVLLVRNDITDSYAQGQLVGGVFGGAAIPLIVGVLLARRSSTVQAPATPAAPLSPASD